MQKKYYFKIQYGYGKDEYLTITQEELPKAIAIFLGFGDRGIFETGALRGREIIRIVPDWNTDQGWSKSWEMDDHDWLHVEQFKPKYQHVYEVAKKYANYIVENKQTHLLKFPFSEIRKELRSLVEPEYEKISPVRDMTKLITEKLKI